MIPLTDEQLEKLSTKRLLNLLQIARNNSLQFEDDRDYCEIGSEEEWDKDVKKYGNDNYYERIKKILDTRPHVSREKRKPTKYDRVTRMR